MRSGPRPSRRERGGLSSRLAILRAPAKMDRAAGSVLLRYQAGRCHEKPSGSKCAGVDHGRDHGLAVMRPTPNIVADLNLISMARHRAIGVLAKASSSGTRQMPWGESIRTRPAGRATNSPVSCAANEKVSCPVHHQDRMVLGAFDRDEPHCRPGYRLADRFGVNFVVLAPFNIGIHVSRRHQTNIAPVQGQFMSLIMCCTARPCADRRRG